MIPPGTAATRDFSGLAPQIPAFLLDACVGCMTCVNACPDSAIFGIAQPTSVLDPAIATFAANDPDPVAARASLRSRFATTKKYADVPARRGLEPAQFGIFVDPVHCKGCAECVQVCHALGYDALEMVDKVPAEASGGGVSTVERYARDMRFFRSLPPTPADYRNEKALADLMLGEHAFGYVGGAGSCSGCGEATALRMLVAATRQMHGPDSMGIVAATGCNTVFGSTYPYNPYVVPWTNSLFENAPAVASGIRSKWDQDGHPDRRLWVVGGDGAMYDIGFQALSRIVASGADIKVLVLDTQVYSNTGGQASTASFGGQVTKLSAFGVALHGRPEPRKELGRILAAHGNVYVAQTTPAHVNHFYARDQRGQRVPRPCGRDRLRRLHAGARDRRRCRDPTGQTRRRLASLPTVHVRPTSWGVACRAVVASGESGARAMTGATLPDGMVVDFLTFARSEGRFAAHFAADGTPTTEICATQLDRLGNWRTLQELAGSIPGRSPGMEE